MQFRPGGFRPFAPGRPVSEWTGRQVPDHEVFASADAAAIVLPDDEDARVAALDAFLLGLGPEADPQAERAMALVEQVRTDRAIRRVAQLSAAEGVSARTLQRLFAEYVGVGPKWVILRYRVHEALERAEAESRASAVSGTGSGEGVKDDGSGVRGGSVGRGEPDWAALAAELGYSDQAHLVRDFTSTVGVPPTAYAATRTPR